MTKTVDSAKRLQYGNWIRQKVLGALGLSALGLGLLSLAPIHVLFRLTAGLVGGIVFLSFLYPLYAYFMFSPRGGNVQDKVYNLLIASLEGQGRGTILDIGAGNGILTVKLALAYPETQVIGIDYWGRAWEYSQSVCEQNARLSGVSDRVCFQPGDAANLEFEALSFEAVVSNLTFHEVKSVAQKRELITETLRVLRPGGTFAFVDLFYDRKYYGDPTEFEAFLRGLALSTVEFKALKQCIAIPTLLNHPKILGQAGIIYGRK
jgi:ubiquinone/menaquinone biosynthesis C-methylase UbiE